MRTCEVCGEPIAERLGRCPYCGSAQEGVGGGGGGAAREASGVWTANLEEGLPTVDEALARLERHLGRAREAGCAVMRVVHGRGSRSGGHGIKDASRARLERWASEGRVRGVIRGEEYRLDGGEGRGWARRHPELTFSERGDRGNPGIAMVEL